MKKDKIERMKKDEIERMTRELIEKVGHHLALMGWDQLNDKGRDQSGKISALLRKASRKLNGIPEPIL